jgi:hypothetical protein
MTTISKFFLKVFFCYNSLVSHVLSQQVALTFHLSAFSTKVLIVDTGSVTLLRNRTCLTIFHSTIYLRLLFQRDPLAIFHIH